MNIGDRVEITSVPEEGYFYQVGDKATLTHTDRRGDWWADFDDRTWGSGDNSFCIQPGFAECKLITEGVI